MKQKYYNLLFTLYHYAFYSEKRINLCNTLTRDAILHSPFNLLHSYKGENYDQNNHLIKKRRHHR